MPVFPNKQRLMNMRNLSTLRCMSACLVGICGNSAGGAEGRPNILFAISDDQSYPHASAYGMPGIDTPAFDRLAGEGVLFHQAFAAAPQCSPSRAAILTGRNIWQLEEAGTHGSRFPRKFPVFTRMLEANGYYVGYTGKAWAPGNWRVSGWERNPVGTEYNRHRIDQPPTSGINDNDYAQNFRAFLGERPDDAPFFFWYGAKEPHRAYEQGSGERAGKDPGAIEPPPFLPDTGVTRQDLLDYALEIEWFDRHLGRMLDILEETGEIDNTIVVVTADNGMPHPYAKANLQEMGTRVPLVIAAREMFPGSRESESLVSLIDLAPTFLELAGLKPPGEMSGQSLLPLLQRGEWNRGHVLTGRERHTHARPDNLGYPARALRTSDFLYIRNFAPERWPAGNPPTGDPEEPRLVRAHAEDFKEIGPGYADIDDSPLKDYMIANREAFPELFQRAFGRRPAEQLFAVGEDPFCLHDLSANSRYAVVLAGMRARLETLLAEEGDPRVLGGGEVFESYPRYGKMRFFPGFRERGAYNPDYQAEEEDP